MERTHTGRRRDNWMPNIFHEMTDGEQTYVPVVPVGNIPPDMFDGPWVHQKLPDRLRIVHISDTHLQHEALRRGSLITAPLPDGDVLIHSGDFNRCSTACCVRSSYFEDLLHEMDIVFGAFPHQLKIFVAGNHESCLEGIPREQIQCRLTNCIYLCDSSTSYAGIKFYGSPHTAHRFMTFAKGFSSSWRSLRRKWDEIPADTDVLITHMPPLGILDLATETLANEYPSLFRLKTAMFPCSTCRTCGFVHPGRVHWGCPALRETVLNRVKPKLHVFGHVHEGFGTLQRDNTVFSNGSFTIKRAFNVFDYYL